MYCVRVRCSASASDVGPALRLPKQRRSASRAAAAAIRSLKTEGRRR